MELLRVSHWSSLDNDLPNKLLSGFHERTPMAVILPLLPKMTGHLNLEVKMNAEQENDNILLGRDHLTIEGGVCGLEPTRSIQEFSSPQLKKADIFPVKKHGMVLSLSSTVFALALGAVGIKRSLEQINSALTSQELTKWSLGHAQNYKLER